MTTPRIDLDRLLGRLDTFNRIGALPGGGNCRLALTDEDRAGRDLLVRWMHDLGLTVTVDAIGNIIGVRGGREDLPPVMFGSHIDTVGTGGRYDGLYGVLAGLEACEALNDAGAWQAAPHVRVARREALRRDRDGTAFQFPAGTGGHRTARGVPRVCRLRLHHGTGDQRRRRNAGPLTASGRRIAIVGTGANGASIGADLALAGDDVTFVEQWPEHVDALPPDRPDAEREAVLPRRYVIRAHSRSFRMAS